MNLQLGKKRAMALLLGLASAALAVFLLLCWLAAQRLIGPSRRALQDYHEEILQRSADHGLVIHPFVMETGSWKGTPCLLCLPSPSPGRAEKGTKLRIQLESEGRVLLPWGQTAGTLVLLHGHTGRKEDHLPVAERLCAAGFGCLLLDLPGHGDHPDSFASFGMREVVLPAAALAEAASISATSKLDGIFMMGVLTGRRAGCSAGQSRPAGSGCGSVARRRPCGRCRRTRGCPQPFDCCIQGSRRNRS